MVTENILTERQEVDIGGVCCISVQKYAEAQNLDAAQLRKAIRDAELPVVGKARSKTRIIDVYEKAAVKKLS